MLLVSNIQQTNQQTAEALSTRHVPENICFINKNYLQKIPAKQLLACEFRVVAKLGENVLIFNKNGPKLQKGLNFGTILLNISRNCGEIGQCPQLL